MSVTVKEIAEILKASKPVFNGNPPEEMSYLNGSQDGQKKQWEICCEFFARALAQKSSFEEIFLNYCKGRDVL